MSSSITNPSSRHPRGTSIVPDGTGDISITVTRSVKVWRSNPRTNMLLMSIPLDISELAGIREGDTLLVKGNADGEIVIVKADRISG